MRTLMLAWRQLRRDLVAGDVRILLAALVLAVMAVSSVGFVTDRAERALSLEANRLLGGDAVLRADEPIVGVAREAAAAPGLRQAETLGFASMVRAGEALRLGEIKAMGEGFPLRGSFRLQEAGGERETRQVPAPGTAWPCARRSATIAYRSSSPLKSLPLRSTNCSRSASPSSAMP